MTYGIYKIVINGLPYVGKSANIEHRFLQHINMLKQGTHHSSKLQDAYNQYGNPKLHILQTLFPDPEHLSNREVYWINKLSSIPKGYNTINAKLSSKSYSYEDQKVIEAFNLILNKASDTDICCKTGITPKMINSIKQGTSHQWLQAEFPKEYQELRATSPRSPYNKYVRNSKGEGFF
jgi:group I intron endonuclease